MGTGIGPVEAHALRRQLVDVRRLHRPAVASERIVGEIVRDEEQNVHLLGSENRCGAKEKGERNEVRAKHGSTRG